MTTDEAAAAFAPRQTIAVIGAGAVGCYYGARLAQAGHDVRFLMRRDYDAVKVNGLDISSTDGDLHFNRPTIARQSSEIGPVDWVLCALKSTSLVDARALIEPCIGPETRILVVMNGLGVEEPFADWFGPECVFGGLAFICVNRGEPGYVHHLGYGALTVGHILDDQASVESARQLWLGARVELVAASCLLRARWEKLCWNIPFNGMTIAAGGVPTRAILEDAGLCRETRAVMEEVVHAGNADLAARGYSDRTDGPTVIERMFSMTSTMGDYRPSTLLDFLDGNPMEVEAIFGEPLHRAQSLGVDTPRLALLTALLRSFNSSR